MGAGGGSVRDILDGGEGGRGGVRGRGQSLTETMSGLLLLGTINGLEVEDELP